MIFHLDVERTQSTLILGLNLRYARMKAGLSLRDMGELANISHTLIANIEHGKTVANQDTLKEIFAILKIQYRDDEELIHDFVERYDRIFNHLYGFYYDRTVTDMNHLVEHENVYFYSIVIIDYLLLRLFHAVLTDTMTTDLREHLDLMRNLGFHFSPRQTQLYQIIVGIDLHNQGWFFESEEQLLKAIQVGDHRLDPLVNLYRVRNQVRMYRFMDAQKTAESTIKRFEEALHYQRAMLVRLQLAYSHISLKKFEDSLHYIRLAEQFAIEFKSDYFSQKAIDLRLSIALLQQNIPSVISLLQRVNQDTVTTLLAQMYLAAMEQNRSLMNQYANQFLQLHAVRQKQRELLFYRGFMMVMGGHDYTDQEFIKLFEQIISHSKRALDMEVLLFGYDHMIQFYRQKRMYKRALELSEDARQFRSFGRV